MIDFPATARVDLLNRQHPDYAAFAQHWDDFDALCDGGIKLRQAADRLLWRRPKELPDVYQERTRRLTAQPILGTVLGWYQSALFRRQPQVAIEPTDERWVAFLENCDRSGTSYIKFWRGIFRQIALFGRAWILVDKPSAGDEAPASRADEIERGLDDPYLVGWDPRQVINWGTDSFGNLEWVLVKSTSESNDFLEQKPNRTDSWLYYDREGYARYESAVQAGPRTSFDNGGEPTAANLVESGTHALSWMKAVPFVSVTLDDELWLTNRTHLKLIEHLNQDNSYSWALFMANLAMPVVYSDNNPNFTASETSYILLGREDKFDWSEPPGRSFARAEQRLQDLREEIYRSFYLQAQGRSSRATPSAQSGYSKELDMMPANDVLNALGDVLRESMQRTLVMAGQARGIDSVDATVTGFRFETQPATDSLALAEEYFALGIPSDTADREMKKRVVRDVFEDSGPALLDKMAREIEAAPSAADQASADKQKQIQAFNKAFETYDDRLVTHGEVNDIQED